MEGEWQMMNKFKKIIASLLALCMLSSVMVFAQDASELYVPECSYEAEVLMALGVMEDISPSNLSQGVTRGMAAHYISNLMKLPSSEISGKFADVTADTAYGAQIEALSGVGVINGTGAGLFEPDRPMLLQEFIKMLVSAAGYGVPSEAQGGYPAGYIGYASRLDLLDGVESQNTAGTFSVGTLAMMLFNSLDVEIMTVDGYTNSDSVNLTTQKGATVLTTFLKCYFAEGQVKSTPKASLTSSETQGEGRALIGDVVYRTGSVEVDDLLGYTANVYYREESGNKTLVHIGASDNNKVTVINGEDVESFTDMTLTYYDENLDTETIRFSSGTDVVFNYRPVAPVTASDLMVDNGTVTVIDCDGNGSADAAIVKSWRTVHARSIDYYNKIIYDKYDKQNKNPLKLKGSDKTVMIYDRKGNIATIDALEADSLLVCIVSRDGTYLEITEVVDEIIGKVEAFEVENGETRVIIGGKTYGVCKELEDYGLGFGTGDKIICYLDLGGNIGMVRDDMVTREKWGYLKDAKKTSGLDATLSVRIMPEGGTSFITYDCASKIKVDDNYKNTVDAQYTELDKYNESIVRYALNADGELALVKTLGNGFVEAFNWETNAANGGDERGLWYDSSIDIFGGKIGVNSETSAFLVPDNGAAEKYVCSTVGKSCTHYAWYKLNAYKLSESQLTADVITFEIASTKGSAVGSASPVMMVDGIRAEKDESGEIIYKIAGYVNGNATELSVEDYSMINDVPAATWTDIPVLDSNGNQTGTKKGVASIGSYTIKKGDLIQYQLDANNMVADARILCTYNKTNKDFDIFGRPDDPRDVTTDYNGNDRAIRGWVYQTDGIFFNVSHASKREDITPLSGAEIYPVISSIGVYVYYPSTDTVKVGGMSDFLSYSQVGTACSRVVAFMTGSDMMAVVLLGE